MNLVILVKKAARGNHWGWFLLLVAMVITGAVYRAGLSGAYLFDDYPNIIDNHGVQPGSSSVPDLVRAALSSPSSEFKRPLASLSFAVNYLATGLDPYWMKLTNLVIHLLNGLLVFLLTRKLLQLKRSAIEALSTNDTSSDVAHTGIVAALVAAGWMLLPINLTAVLYVVQRMESMANVFVLLGLLGYVAGRRRMIEAATTLAQNAGSPPYWWPFSVVTRGLILCAISITVPLVIGVLAKETAVMLPLYALLIEWVLFEFKTLVPKLDYRIITLFLLVLAAISRWIRVCLARHASWLTISAGRCCRRLIRCRSTMIISIFRLDYWHRGARWAAS
jgi:hypothetical protein